MKIPENLRYSKEHEWVKIEGKNAKIGITDFAQENLGEIVFVELPSPGDELSEMDSAASVESVKSVSEVYSPLKGTVKSVNEELEDQPELINQDPYGRGWIFRLALEDEEDIEELLTSEEYTQYLKQQE